MCADECQKVVRAKEVCKASFADLLGEASRLFACAHYEKVRKLMESALSSFKEAPEDFSQAAKELIEIRYVLAASLVQLGDYKAARKVIADIKARDKEHPGAALQEIYIEKGEGKTCTEMVRLQRLVAWLKKQLKKDAPTELLAYYQKLLAESYSLLGSALTRAGRAGEGVLAFLHSSRLEKDDEKRIEEYSNALFTYNYLSEKERAPFSKLLTGFNSFFRLEDRLQLTPYKHERLHIGYISPDLCYHPVAFFLLPLLRAFDRTRFSVFCYANNSEDAVSRTMAQQEGVLWRNILDLTPKAAARQIADDEIDILVDLAGHTCNNCLPILAKKPAPVQITGIGYMGRTGLLAIDYLLSDTVLDPDKTTAAQNTSEIALRLFHSHLCYLPFIAMPDVSPPPCLLRGFITFGCFNNYSKVTDEMLLLWRRLLTDLPTARLLLKSRLFNTEEGKMLARERFWRLGLDVVRIELRSFSANHLKEYADMDIALDTSPYTGGLTTCEALYMGVPVVTLCGKSHGARFGASLLKNANLIELIAYSKAQYIDIAKTLAASPETLTYLREKQRSILQTSPLMDFRRYVKEVEAAYEYVWQIQKSKQSGQNAFAASSP